MRNATYNHLERDGPTTLHRPNPACGRFLYTKFYWNMATAILAEGFSCFCITMTETGHDCTGASTAGENRNSATRPTLSPAWVLPLPLSGRR